MCTQEHIYFLELNDIQGPFLHDCGIIAMIIGIARKAELFPFLAIHCYSVLMIVGFRIFLSAWSLFAWMLNSASLEKAE